VNGKHVREEELSAINISSPVIAGTFKKVKNRIENIRRDEFDAEDIDIEDMFDDHE
jgi:hypothetical protein